MKTKTAIVTGASRGIGKATAIALAGAGYDVAITARTIEPGTGEVTGSLTETAAAIRDAGQTPHIVAMDLLDKSGLLPAAQACITALGHVDVLVNNAIYVSAAGRKRFLDADLDDIDRRIQGNLAAQLRFMQPVVAHMVERGSGTVLNMTSGAGYAKPFAPPDDGGWNLAYSVAKGGFHRIAPQLHYEYGDGGLISRNVQPGFVATERVLASGKEVARIAAVGASPTVIGKTVAHVADTAAGFDPNKTIQLQDVAVELGLLDRVRGIQ